MVMMRNADGMDMGNAAANAMNEGGEAMDVDRVSADDEEWTCCFWFKFIGTRILIISIVIGLAFLIPNINILLTIGGAVLGTIVNIVVPVLFYNRAYNYKEKNKELETPEERKDQDDSLESKEEDKDEGDPRMCTKITSWIVLVLGVIIGIIGLVYVIRELAEGSAKEDEA